MPTVARPASRLHSRDRRITPPGYTIHTMIYRRPKPKGLQIISNRFVQPARLFLLLPPLGGQLRHLLFDGDAVVLLRFGADVAAGDAENTFFSTKGRASASNLVCQHCRSKPEDPRRAFSRNKDRAYTRAGTRAAPTFSGGRQGWRCWGRKAVGWSGLFLEGAAEGVEVVEGKECFS